MLHYISKVCESGKSGELLLGGAGAGTATAAATATDGTTPSPSPLTQGRRPAALAPSDTCPGLAGRLALGGPGAGPPPH